MTEHGIYFENVEFTLKIDLFFEILVTQTSYMKSRYKALINVDQNTNQLVSCVFTSFLIIMAWFLIPSHMLLSNYSNTVPNSISGASIH